jgi:hypothetical protein
MVLSSTKNQQMTALWRALRLPQGNTDFTGRVSCV